MVQSLPQSDGFRLLFHSPELSEVQRSGFHLFLRNGIAEELSKISCIQLKDAHFSVDIVIDAQNFRLVTPENNYRDCILKMKSYTCKLYVQAKILFKDKFSGELLYQTQPEWVLLADLPMMTKRGHFVINGSPRVVVHQVGRAPGIYFKKVVKVKKDVNNKARFYGDIIPHKGVWVRLQISKRGEIDLKLKKSKKVRAEMVQKCLELLEKEDSLSHLKKESFDKINELTKVPTLFKNGVVKQKGQPFLSLSGQKQGYTKGACHSFFSPQSSSLVGIGTNNCFSTKTRQTQAFVVSLSRNKLKTVVSPVWYHVRPWLTAMSGNSIRVRTTSRLKGVLDFTRLPSTLTAARLQHPTLFLSKQVDRTRLNVTAKEKINRTSGNNLLQEQNGHLPTKIPVLFNNTPHRTVKKKLVTKTRSEPAKVSFHQNLVTGQLFHNNANLGLTKKPGLPLGASVDQGKRSPFTKAEKEAFANIYTSFYKNDVKDVEKRVSMSSLSKKNQYSAKKSSLNSISLSMTELSTPLIRKRTVLKTLPEKKDLLPVLQATSVTKPELLLQNERLSKNKKISNKRKIANQQNISSNLEKIREYLSQLFKKSDLYDLGPVGREKINTKFGICVRETQLTSIDIKETINWLSKLRAGKEEVDDIDHSQNRRVRTSSELIQTQFSLGVTRLKSIVAKKVRNGKLEQIKKSVLPNNIMFLSDRQEAEISQSPVKNPFFSERSIKQTCFDGLDFRGGSSCFVKRNKILDKVRLNLEKRTTFTSINPYFLTSEKKQRYCVNLSKFQPVCRKSDRCQKLLGRFKYADSKKALLSSAKKGVQSFHLQKFGVLAFTPLASTTEFRSRVKRSLDHEAKQAHKQGTKLSDFPISELFSTKPINGALREFFSSSPLSQYMDQTNPLAEITHKRRLSSLGVGGVSRESAGMTIRGIHPTHYGRICPIETPEGKNAGLVNSLAFYAKINNHGFIETPYYQVIKGQIQHELGFSFYSAGKESRNGLYIAPNDIKHSQSKLLAKTTSTVESIPVRVADNVLDLFKKVSPYQVDCIGISPVQILSVATSLIPFLEHNDANRALMGSNMQRQAVSLMISERPLVGTGLEARVLAESGHLVQSKVSGFVSHVSAHKVVVERLVHDLTLRKPKLLTKQSLTSKQARAKVLVLHTKRSFLRSFEMLEAFSPTQSNHSGFFSSTKKRFAFSPVTHSITTFSRSNQETCLIQKPLVEEGDWVQKGDMVSDCSAGQKGELSVGKNVLIAYIPWQGYNFEDAIVISDRLVKEQLYSSLHIERYTVLVNDFRDKVVDTNEWLTGSLPGVDSKKVTHLQRSGLPVIGTILREGDILVGKIKYSKKKPATPHERLVCDILGEHNFSVQNSSLYVPKGINSARVLTYKIKKRFEKALKNNLRPAGAPKVVHIFLGEKRNIQVGDKMSGRHGNKGIVSTILPKQDMPYLADGSPIDILLNPLGVPSRMNVGQVFECLLGLASTYLHQNFKVTAFDELYGVEASQSLVFLKLYQARLQSGQNWLFQVNFPGKTRLTDGRSGECLDQWITVGRAYMLKLIHMVNEKIHARAIGPYALVTQQPLKGRAHKGGQRLGEMEVWAVEGFGAAYILQELLTKKSDDSIGRKEVLKAMLPKSADFLDSLDPFGQAVQVESTFGLDKTNRSPTKKGDRLNNAGEALTVLGQPDIFKVLICELQALCLDVGVYSMKAESFQRKFLGIFSDNL